MNFIPVQVCFMDSLILLFLLLTNGIFFCMNHGMNSDGRFPIQESTLAIDHRVSSNSSFHKVLSDTPWSRV